MKPPSNHVFEHTPESLAEWCASVDMPRFRARQVLEWVYQKGVVDPARMSNLSKPDREKLAAGVTFLSGRTLAHQRASDGVQKLLVQWEESDDETKGRSSQGQGSRAIGGTVTLSAGGIVSLPVLSAPGSLETLAPFVSDPTRQTECVMIPTEERKTACISSQVGCPVGCRFCASGLGGLDANLSAGRIVEQVWRLRDLLVQDRASGSQRGTRDLDAGPESAAGRGPRNGRGEGEPTAAPRAARLPCITNVVFMGMGEPLSNFVAVTSAIRTLSALWGMGISARKITISTVGLPKFIERLANEFELPVTLALSLHAPNDEIRRKLIPWAEYTTIDDLLAACKKWFEKTGREITLEYTLLRGVNDQVEHARELAGLAKTLRANVNLIRYNEVEGLEFKRPRDDDVRTFQGVLHERGVNTHIRASRGRDIAAACGQLRHEKASVG